MPSQPLPSYDSTTIGGRKVLIDDSIPTQADSILLDSGNSDAGSSPTHLFRAGNVVVLRTSTGRYVEADDTNGDRNAVATITSKIAIAATAASKTFIWQYKGGAAQTVTLSSTDTTCDLVVAALNADRDFAADLIAMQL